MHFPKFWMKGHWSGQIEGGRHVERDAWGWSDVSQEDAAATAVANAKRAAHANWNKKPDLYLYADRPLREEVLSELEGAVVSRNSYGAEILNSKSLAIVDVDLPEQSKPGGGMFSGLFSGKRKAQSLEEQSLEKLRKWQGLNRGFSFRVYRTAGGLRYLLISKPLSATDSVINSLFDATGCDPRYRQLCVVQKSFRARLTPKPWRADFDKPRHRFPYSSDSERMEMNDWIAKYNDLSSRYASCRYLETVGTSRVIDEFSEIVALHDQRSGAESGLQLA